MSKDALVQSAISHWAPGFGSNGVLLADFEEVTALSDHRLVYWCEVRGKGVFLHASPVDVSSDLQSQLYTRLKTAVFTSATLSAQGNFRFFKGRGNNGRVFFGVVFGEFARQIASSRRRKLCDLVGQYFRLAGLAAGDSDSQRVRS